MKTKLLRSLILIAVLSIGTHASAHDFEVDGIFYNVTGNTATVTYKGSSSNEYINEYTGSVTIPESVTYDGTTYSVTTIGYMAFDYCNGLTSITIPNSVTTIGDYAFHSCTGLTNITIPNSVTTIGGEAFNNCNGLTNITIPNSVTSIDGFAFAFCTGLTSITIPNSVTSIGDAAFGGCDGLTSIFVESDNPKYDSRDNCNAIIETATNTLISGCITTVIPNSVTSIGDYAFGGCTDLKNVIIPNTVTSIGSQAFDGCYNLTSVSLPNSVTTIGDRAFRSCNYLTNLTLPISVTSIGEYAFEGCYDLTSVTSLNPTPPTCKTDVFKNVNTQNITLSVPAESVELYASADTWKGFGTIVAAEPEASDLYYNIISDTEVEVIAGETKYTGDIVIPSKTTIDGKTYSVTTIGDYAFNSCTGLTNITIPNSVTTIGYKAFYLCTGLTSVTIGNSVTSIGEYAFYLCTGLTSVIIPNSVTSIGSWAFSDCTGLTSIVVERENPVYDSRDNCNAIIETATNTLIYGCKTTLIPSSVTSIGDIAFNSCTGLTNITIPNSVTTIGGRTFENCGGLTSVTIPESVTTIGQWAFETCTSLTSIVVESGNTVYDSRDNCNAIIETATNTLILGCKTTIIPSSVTSIGESAFQGCRGLTSVTIPNSVTRIGSYAFFDCTGLTSVIIPNSVTSIGSDAFKGCTGLTSVIIPNSVTSIGGWAFEDCTGLTNITIPNSVTTIGYMAFSDCTSLTNITIGNSVSSIGGTTFYNTGWYNNQPDGILYLDKYCFGYKGEKPTGDLTLKDETQLIASYAFHLCTGLTSVTIPNTVTTIGEYAFYNCTGLTSITIPNSVTSIESSAFYNCSNLTSLTIPNSVTSIGSYAFYYTDWYNNQPNGILYLDKYCLGYKRVKPTGVLTLKDDTRLIAGSAFFDCTELTSVEIPNSVTHIGRMTFESCTGLTNITIPNSVTTIEDYAFGYCTGLTSVEIGNSVTSIGEKAFRGCSGLTSVTSLNPTPPTCGYNVFLSVDIKNLTLYVPAGSVEFYASADTWKGFGTIVGLESETPVEYGFEAEDITTLHNRTIDLPVSLINAGDVSAFQFDIYLPEGISIAIDEDEEYEMTLNQDRATSSHSVFTLKQPNGAIRYACYSTKSSAFKGESGTTLFTIPLTIAENLEGEYKVIIKDIILSSSDAQGYNCQDVEINITVKPYDYGDSNGDGNINIVDVVNTMNVVLGKDSARFIEEAADINADGQINIVDVVGTMNLVLGYTRTATPTSILKQISKKSATEESVYIEDFSICATESKIIDLNMTNNQAYSAIQFDIVMPEGLTIDYDENEEEYLFESTDRFTKSHSINSNQLSENTIRVGIYSTKSKDFTANEGALIRIPFTASEDMAAGEYKVEIKGIVLSTSDSQGVYLPDTQATLIVYPATMTDVEETLYDVDVEYYNLQGVKVAKKNLNQGVYIKKVGTNSTKVFIK